MRAGGRENIVGASRLVQGYTSRSTASNLVGKSTQEAPGELVERVVRELWSENDVSPVPGEDRRVEPLALSRRPKQDFDVDSRRLLALDLQVERAAGLH